MTRLRLALVFAAAISPLTAAEPADVLLFAADEATLQPVLAKITNAQANTRAAWTCWRGQLAGRTVALAQGEGDPLNAVAAATLAIRLHAPKLIVIFGSARAHDPALRAGDFVVSESFAAFDGMLSGIAELDRGSHPQSWQLLPHLLMTAGERETPAPSFPADATALKTALALKPPHGRVLRGVLGSANQINREADRIAWLRATWHTSTEDRVSAHVAGCAKLFAIPVVGLCVVDAPGGEAAALALLLVEALR